MAVQFKRCRTCGQIFQTAIDGDECPNCVEEREWSYERVKDYLYEHPGATMAEVVDDTGVDLKLVRRFLREGRVELETADGFLLCEKCGKPITSGTMCQECKTQLSRAMDSVLPQSLLDKRDGRERPEPLRTRNDKLHVKKR